MDYLIAGLGNPGTKYDYTRHNIGFEILDRYANDNNLIFKTGNHVLKTEHVINGKKILIIKPQTFMNLSGKAIQYWLSWYKIPVSNCLVLVDDIALSIGKLRIRKGGSSGGHNGLKDIERLLGTKEYPRLRFGVGHSFNDGKQIDFVLSKFPASEKDNIDTAIDLSCKAIESFVINGIDKTMEEFNRK